MLPVPQINVVTAASRHAPSSSLIRSRGPHNATSSTSSSGTAAMASFFFFPRKVERRILAPRLCKPVPTSEVFEKFLPAGSNPADVQSQVWFYLHSASVYVIAEHH